MAEPAESSPRPEGRDRDARVAACIASGHCDAAEVRAWISGFHRWAIVYALRWRHTPEDAEELVQGFWRYAFQTHLFEHYSPDRGTLDGFVKECFRHEFYAAGKRLASRRDREAPLDPAFAVRDDLIDTLETDEAMRQVGRCLGKLGLQVGDAGWLIQQVFLVERSYAEVAEQLFSNEPQPGERLSTRLRQRVWKGLKRLRECLEKNVASSSDRRRDVQRGTDGARASSAAGTE
jgi:hypothetical protein